MSSLLPLNSSAQEHALDNVAEQKLKLDFTFIDRNPLSCAATLLPFLAYERGVNIDGLTQAQSRILIKSAREIRKYKGSVYAVELALLSMFDDAQVLEFPDSAERAFEFDASVNLPTNENAVFDDNAFIIARRLINAAKNGRSRFINFNINLPEIAANVIETNTAALALGFANVLHINGEIHPQIQTAIKWDLKMGVNA